jgi:hypothetical protein
VSWKGRESGLVKTHLPYELGLRDRRPSILPSAAESADAMLSGDLYAAPDNVFLNVCSGYRPYSRDRSPPTTAGVE